MLTGTDEYTRFMVRKFDERRTVPVPTAFQGSFYGVPENGGLTLFPQDAKVVEIDIIRAVGNTMAQLVNRGTSSLDTDRIKSQTETKFTNVARKWPLAETLGHINSDELLDRTPGMTANDVQTQQDRLSMKAFDIHEEAGNKQLTLIEYLARQALLTGEHPMILGTVNANLIYDFYRSVDNFITAGTVWTNVAADIDGDIDSGYDVIQQNTFLSGDAGIIIGGTAFGGFKKNTAIRSDADNRRFQFVQMGAGGGRVEVPTEFQRYVDNGFTPRGYLETTKGRRIWIFTYDLTFIDNFTVPGVNTVTNWMPVDQALLFNPKARCDRYFGPRDRMPLKPSEIQWMMETFGFNMASPPVPATIVNPAAYDPRMYFCDAFESADKKTYTIRTQSAPIMPTTQTDGFVTFSGLA